MRFCLKCIEGLFPLTHWFSFNQFLISHQLIPCLESVLSRRNFVRVFFNLKKIKSGIFFKINLYHIGFI